MNPFLRITVIFNLNHTTINTKELKPGMLTLGNLKIDQDSKPMSEVFFVYKPKDNKLLTRFYILWKDKKGWEHSNIVSQISIGSSDITFGDYEYNKNTVPLNKTLRLGPLGEKARIIKKEVLAGKVVHFFTESEFFLVSDNNENRCLLLRRKHDRLLKYTKYLNRLSSIASKVESHLVGNYLTRST